MTDAVLDTIAHSRNILVVFGLFPDISKPIKTRICGFLTYTINVAFVFSMISELANHLDDYAILSEHISITIPSTSFMFKLTAFILAEHHFFELMEIVHSNEFNSYPNEVENIIWKSAQFTKTVAIVFQSACALTVLLYIVMPFVTGTNLPVMFSFNLGSYVPAMFVFQVIGLASAAINNSCLDILAMGLMGLCSSEIDILNEKIRGFRNGDAADNSLLQKQNLSECVELHNKIIRFVENLEKVFSTIILIQYITSAAVICNIGFQLALTQQISIQFSKMLLFFIAMMVQLALYCAYGNEIIVKSEGIKDACYQSDWLNSDIKIQKLLITIAERSNRNLFLTAGKFSILSWQSFSSVIKTSYSYFALIQTLYGKSSGKTS